MQYLPVLIQTQFFSSILLIEAAKLLITPRGRTASQSPREMPRKPASVQQILYAIGGMSRREKLKSGERYDPKEGRWKSIGKVPLDLKSPFNPVLLIRGGHLANGHVIRSL